MKSYLFVCQHNFTRSKFGADFFRGYLRGKGIAAKVRSAGVGFISNFLGNRVDKKVKGFDYIFVMEDYMKEYLINKFNVNKTRITVLGIKDEYGLFRKKSMDSLEKFFEKIKWEKYLK